MMRLGTGAYDVCLVDQGLPDGDGLGLLHAAHNRGFRAPIVMLTGCSTLEREPEAFGGPLPLRAESTR
jgi:DNA-binding response OmpR family regulator